MTGAARRAPGTSGVAQAAQNFAPGGLVVDPHAGQGATSGVAHSVQNRAPGPLPVPQLEQVATAMASGDAVRSSGSRGAKDTGRIRRAPASNGSRAPRRTAPVQDGVERGDASRKKVERETRFESREIQPGNGGEATATSAQPPVAVLIDTLDGISRRPAKQRRCL